jgi:hypothetical protein
LEQLSKTYPDIEFRQADGWARIPSYPMLSEIWGRTSCEVAFKFPDLPGQPPYGFWVRPGLTLVNGATIVNYTHPAETPFGPDWGQFSWSPEEWRPGGDVRLGSNMLQWAESFAARLAEGA